VKHYLILAIGLAVSACGGLTDGVDEDAYDRGYNDGYAVGYNTTCEIRATLVEGDWSNEDYSRGYAEGPTAGTIACNADKEAGVLF
jgi:hypothetical protein